MATLWVDTIFGLNVASDGQSSVELDETAFTVQERRSVRWTLIRTILRLDIAATVRDSGEGDQLVTLGIGVVSQEAFAALTLPEPGTGLDFPIKGWVYRARYRVYAVAVDDQNVDVVRIDLDLRARRLMANGRLVLIADNTPNQGTATAVTISGIVRSLFLVP